MAKTESPYLNRELSWIEFNQRVLNEANDESVPLLDRLFFLTITASNLDEFFMVRVGGLDLLRSAGVTKRDPAGWSPKRQLSEISRRVHRMVADQYTCYAERLLPALEEAGIRRLTCDRMSGSDRKMLREIFDRELFPVITPMMLGSSRPVPLIHTMDLFVAVALESSAGGRARREYAAIPVSRALDRVRMLPSSAGDMPFVLVEDVVAAFIEEMFPGHKILETAPFRITRNADVSLDEDFAEDLIAEMEKVLSLRKKSRCVRLEIGSGASKEMEAFLAGFLEVDKDLVFRIPGPIDLTGLRPLVFLEECQELRYAPLLPQQSPLVEPKKSIFDQVARRDILLSHPFESFDPVIRLVDEAADDPDVLAIKQILYRTSPDSPIVEALKRAALNGKYVTVVVELRARFDEARNISWARRLEEAGVQVIYGIRHLKIHSKICLVVRRESDGIARYVHFGTGNYNQATARLYTDVGLLTRNPEFGSDASAFFNAVTGRSEPVPYLKVEQSPWRMRSALLEMIGVEAARRRRGQKALIMAKMNSLVDTEMIDALYKASQAGVQVLLNVRGICCLRPGVKGLSENIRVVSIIDRFLEHSRIFYFHHGGEKRTYISSADWMTRNLSRRVELLVPVEDKTCRKRLIRILEACFSDNVKASEMLPDGTYRRIMREPRKKVVRAQELLYRLACEASLKTKQTRRTVFEPHFSPGAGAVS